MPDKTSSENETSEPEKGGSKRIITAAVLSVVMAAVGYFAGGMMSGGTAETPVAAAGAETAETVAAEKSEMGKLVDLEPVNVNLADGHFLRIAVTLELDPHKESSDGHGAKDESFPTAPAADLVLSTFSGRDMSELQTMDGREEARTTLMHSIEEAYHGDVVSLYFTEFVMQ